MIELEGESGAAHCMVEVFSDARFRAMELITILNRCHRFQGFIYQHARFTPDKEAAQACWTTIAVHLPLSTCHGIAAPIRLVTQALIEIPETAINKRAVCVL